MRITLLNGLEADTEDIRFNPSNYHFYWGDFVSMDITDVVSRADKRSFAGFDDTQENLRLSNIRTGANAGLEDESTLSIFGEQIVSDPLAAPLSALDTAAGKLLSSPGIWFTVALVGIALAVWLVIKKVK